MPAEILLLLAAAKAALLIGTALLLVACLPRASAAIRHAVRLAAMIGALLVPLLGATLPTFSFPWIHGRPAFVSPESGPSSDNPMPISQARSDAVSDLHVASSPQAVVESWRVGILTFWLAGTAFMLCGIAADLAAAHRTLRRATLRRRLDAGIPLLESAEIGTPVAVGLFRPAIMVPEGATVGAVAFQPVIAHELALVERRDCLTQLITRLACALYWFNPVVWYAAHRVALEQERACDDRVLASGADPIGYSRLLIEMARRHARLGVQPHAAAPSMARAAHLERRIAGILDARAERRGMSRRRHLALTCAVGCIVVPLAAFGLHDPPVFAAESDPFLDPQSERLGGIRGPVPAVLADDLTTVDGMLIATLRGAARREPEAPHDLVPDRARWALSRARDGTIIEPLIGELREPDWRVRGYAAWALGLSRDPRAVDPLIPLLRDPVWRLRAMAAFALRQIGDPRAAAALAEALDDPSWQVRVEAGSTWGSSTSLATGDASRRSGAIPTSPCGSRPTGCSRRCGRTSRKT